MADQQPSAPRLTPKAQKTVIAVALALIVLIVPPWHIASSGTTPDVGYWAVWREMSWGAIAHVNIGYLLVQLLGVVLVAVACCYLATRPPPHEERRAP